MNREQKVCFHDLKAAMLLDYFKLLTLNLQHMSYFCAIKSLKYNFYLWKESSVITCLPKCDKIFEFKQFQTHITKFKYF